MSIRRNLASVVSAGVLALSGSGCFGTIYDFNGKIGYEQVKFGKTFFDGHNILEVKRADGTSVKYFDNDMHDLKVDWIRITNGKEYTDYEKNLIGEKTLQEGQRQFDDYLAKILELKQAKGLKDIKKDSI